MSSSSVFPGVENIVAWSILMVWNMNNVCMVGINEPISNDFCVYALHLSNLMKSKARFVYVKKGVKVTKSWNVKFQLYCSKLMVIHFLSW